MSEKIVFNEETYDSLEQMPPDQRKAYEAIKGMFADLDTNRVSDFFVGVVLLGAVTLWFYLAQ
jgi:hypothetical protein